MTGPGVTEPLTSSGALFQYLLYLRDRGDSRSRASKPTNVLARILGQLSHESSGLLVRPPWHMREFPQRVSRPEVARRDVGFACLLRIAILDMQHDAFPQ